MSIDPINEAFIAASSLQASDDIHKSFRETFDLSQCTKVIPDTLSLLVRSLSDEVEARFERSFAQRDAELLRLRADVIKLKDEAALTLATAKKYVENVDRKFENFLESMAFQNAVDHQITIAFKTDDEPDLDRRIRTTMCDILRHTAFVVPTS